MPKAKRSAKPAAATAPRASAGKPSLPRPDAVPRTPVWAGPSGEGPNGGVTQSLLHRWLVCRERSRLTLVEGLKPADTFSAPLEFGQMWHVCEESLADKNPDICVIVKDILGDYVQGLFRKYPFQREQVAEWYAKCAALFPLYVEHWAEHDDVKNRTPLLAEQTFDVPYRLPSGRTVRLRGKWDSVDLVNGGVWLQENKTKGTIDRTKVTRQLAFDLQTMVYIVALEEWRRDPDNTWPVSVAARILIKGVRYNVVRRSAHKSVESMLKKFHEDRNGGRGEEWFARWTVEVSPADVQRFRTRCLDPILEQLCRWWGHVRQCNTEAELYGSPFNVDDGNETPIHWQSPFSSYSYGVVEGGTDMDEAVLTGGTVGLRKVANLFEELV